VQYSTANTIYLDITGEVLRLVKACKNKIILVVSGKIKPTTVTQLQDIGDVNAAAIRGTPAQYLIYLTAIMVAARNEKTMNVS